ncbi:PspC domain-containing protein [Tunicatimonas pelagia]|uniref:PspC domain-containing protein n=1 Tax=Tunicatimonas pelagia TaxID=931531 RepID=UPI002664F44E|nr:PspC domain-containing protein [Tunicatimonas pelagia]WKN42496.1 PspC domain-containing protein [Tunicatimonas pelagia]
MKRNISINISGIIFHVEEDGYELLRNYLDAISRYFSNYEDNKEITDDIESRIAEIFLKKLSSSKQVITKEDVEGVVAIMGSVEDFAAQDYGDDEAYTYADSGAQTDNRTSQEEPEGQRRLYRDTQRKVLGGVAAGVAHYFRTDPLWVRLLLIFGLFADAFITFGTLSTITLISYIVLWIVLPGRTDLDQSEKVKKLFRNPNDEVIGGVAGGLALYLGIDTTVLRLLFVLSALFGGSGLIIYIVLWIITPPAKTLTDRMQMKGEPITLTNIESSIKKNFSVSESGEESTLLKAVLFPFRLVSAIFTNLGRALGPFLIFLGDAARVLFGLLLIVVGGSILLSVLVTSGVTLGMATTEPYFWGVNIPMEVIKNSFSGAGLVFATIALLMPALALVISGISIIARRRLISAAVVWTGVGIWFVSLIGLAATVPPVIMGFREEAQYTSTEDLPITGKIPVLRLTEYPEYDDSKVVLFLAGHSKDQFELQKSYQARGSSRKKAVENARLVTYDILVEDSIISFPPVYTFKEGAKFRAQELDLTLRIPYNQPFQMEQSLTEILRNTLYRYGYRRYDLPGNTFIFTQDGLKCISCEEEEADEPNAEIDSLKSFINKAGGESYRLGLRDFESVEVRGPFRVQISPSEEYLVDVIPNDMPLSRMKANVEDGRLVIYYNGSYNQRNSQVYDLSISLPTLQQLKLKGDTRATVTAFSEQDLDVDLSGSAQLTAEVSGVRTKVAMTGDSEAELSGKTQLLNTELGGSSLLKAFKLNTDTARVESRAASEAQLYVSEKIEADISGAGRVEYQGDPEVTVNEAGQTKLRKVEEEIP